MLLLHRLSRRQHSFACAPWVNFSLDHTRSDGRIVLHQLSGLLCAHAENGDSPQLALIAERQRARNGKVSLICHQCYEGMMVLHHVHELRRVWVPMVAALHQHDRVLLESGSLAWIVNSARVNEPGSMHLGG